MKKLTTFLALVLSFALGEAQISVPQPSPLAKINHKIGLTDFTVSYSRPSVKNRKIFGELVPYDQLWRTGANAATAIQFSDDTKFEGQFLRAGKYVLFTIPGNDSWTIVINKDTALWGIDGYKEENDALRFKVNTKQLPNKIETFTIDFNDLTNNSANLNLSWENTQVSVKIEVDVDSKVMEQIREKILQSKDVSATTYYQAARYYFDTNRDLNKALEWVNASLSKEEKYWVMTLKSRIEAGLEDYKSAISTATKAKELAIKDENPDYIRMNEKNIAEWKNKL
jgi:hypothetical protein